jgi:hypothetical protein
MKHPFKICDLRFTIWKKSAKSAAANRQSSIVNRKSQGGVALIITVILLSVLTLMTLAFLSMSRRERGAVTTTTDTASARLAADAALANAEAQILANALATTNPYNFGLIVSTNYPPYGFANLADYANLYISPRAPVFIQTNGALDFRFYLDLNRNGQFDTNGWVTNFDNLGGIIYHDPVTRTNPVVTFQVGDPEWIGILQRPDQPYGPNNSFVARFAFIAVPIGNALDLNAIHNEAVTKQTRPNSTDTTVNDGFLRNQGVGSWEINLAAFLTDLNTNQWDPNANFYNYRECLVPNLVNIGAGFDDALSLLSYRYGYNYNNLASVDNLFGGPPLGAGYNVFINDNIDGYSDGPLQTTLANINEGILANQDDPTKPWSGADNTNHFFSLPSDLFNPAKSSFQFTNNLWSAGTSNATYDRYTFYRLLSQLGTDSAPEQNKMNLNYRNVTNGVVVPNLETSFYPWTAIEFFTNAADRMLRDYSQEWLASNPSNFVATFNVTNAFGIANIPVLVSNQFVYTPAIQRVLQLAANIYDATTNNTAVLGANFPSVFRPVFNVVLENGYTDVYIDGYEQVVSVTGTNDLHLALPVDITDLPVGTGIVTNVYGVPWIIGAKKGFPNFNEFSMESIVGVTRRLQFTRTAINLPPPTSVDFSQFHTNQMYTMCISNSLGVECWNSYTNNYVPVSGLNIVVNDTLSMVLTNSDGLVVATGNLPLDNSVSINALSTPPYWPGNPLPWTGDGQPNSNSFDIPLLANVVMQLNPSYTSISNWWAYRFDTYNFLPVSTSSPDPTFETDVSGFPFPQFGLLTTNRLQVFMLDGNHVIDYVHFAGPDTTRDLNAEIFTDDINGVWNTNASSSGVPYGILNQIQISKGSTKFPAGPRSEDGTWHGDAHAIPLGGTPPQQQAFFGGFFRAGNVWSAPRWGGNDGATATNLEFGIGSPVDAPYEPTRYVVLYTTWQANDPLVHYIASDLNYTLQDTSVDLQPGTNTFNYGTTIPTLTSTNANLGQLNNHYKPWGRNVQTYNLAVKDPLVWLSDDWDFPTYKLPTVGWLGRVHRGTPWQTVYMKSTPVGINTWTSWTGNVNLFDATNTMPVQDWLLFDLFTTAFNDNATRGQLSVNVGANDPNNPQAGLAAWSALFSGVIALSNNAVLPPLTTQMILTGRGVQRNGSLTNFTAFPINPAGSAGANSALGGLVTNINQTRASFTNVYGIPAFEHIGDILATPALTVQSTNLNWSVPIQRADGISDEMYEWLPQQVMSLLRVGGSPRYVIYSYGQTLKPAPGSIYSGSGSFFGMVTNYQVVSETATRAVVRFGSTLTNVVSTNASGALVMTNQVINNNAVIESFNVLPPD